MSSDIVIIPPIYLVTTSIEETWVADSKIVFLSKGCLKYSRYDFWSELNYEVINHPWENREIRNSDFEYLLFLYEELMTHLSVALNSVHKTSYSERYWKTLIGYWLYIFLSNYLEKWRALKLVEEKYPNVKIKVLDTKNKLVAANDNLEFANISNTDLWNEMIYADIIKKWTKIGIEILDEHNTDHLSYKVKKFNVRLAKREVLNFILKLGSQFKRKKSNSKYFFYYSYLPLNWILKLKKQINIAVFPFFSTKTPSFPYDSNLRNWNLNNKRYDDFTIAVSEIIPRLLPRCYIEGYEKLNKGKIRWPGNPKIILTANAFAFDQSWGSWAAKKIEQGSKLVISQHGGNYESHKYHLTQEYELSISHKYISWGWNINSSDKIITGPAFKLIGLKRSHSHDGNILFVTQSEPRYCKGIHQLILPNQMFMYLEFQFRFIRSLKPHIRNSIQLRLYPQEFGWEAKDRWQAFYPKINICDSKKKIGKLIKQSKLVLIDHDGTTFLETFTMDTPTVLFWSPEIFVHKISANSFYQILAEASILHYSPESCATFIESIWDDVQGWWESEKVRNAVHIFKNNYARVGENPDLQIKSILTQL
jgi:putative transferase (TIGR04331 family)